MLNSNKDNVNKEREFNFAKRLREILKGDYNDEFIAAGHLPASKTKGTPLTNQEVIDIIKAITNKESGSKQSITDWLGSTTPKMEYIIKLAEFFGASIDWMIGLTDNRTPEKQDEETLFRKLGISRESWQALTQNRKLLENSMTVIQGDRSSLTDSDIMYNESIVALNCILSDYIVVDGKVTFPVLESIHKYIDIESQKPAVKVYLSTLEDIKNVNDIEDSIISDYLEEDIDRPYTSEEINKYVAWYNELHFYGEEGKGITPDSFNPEEDNSFKEFIKRIRIQDMIYKYITNLSKELNVEELETESLSYIKTNLRNLKIKCIKAEIEYLMNKEEELKQMDENSMFLADVIRERQTYEKMLSNYIK